jgi:hypothetical protein
VVSRCISNWSLPESDFDVVELGSGVSLVLGESTPYREGGDLAPLGEALRRARGPWRVLAIHTPPAHAAFEEGTQRMQAALRTAGVPVQLFLSGDVHNLQVLRPPEGIGGLHVVAGGGADVEPILSGREPLFGLESQGFARVDLAGSEDAPRLYLTLFATPRFGIEGYFVAGREAVARWSVDLSGDARSEPFSGEPRGDPLSGPGDASSRTR